MKNIIIHEPTYECPYCGHTSKRLFPIEKYSGGSSGYRTFRCPKCSRVMEE